MRKMNGRSGKTQYDHTNKANVRDSLGFSFHILMNFFDTFSKNITDLSIGDLSQVHWHLNIFFFPAFYVTSCDPYDEVFFGCSRYSFRGVTEDQRLGELLFEKLCPDNLRCPSPDPSIDSFH